MNFDIEIQSDFIYINFKHILVVKYTLLYTNMYIKRAVCLLIIKRDILGFVFNILELFAK